MTATTSSPWTIPLSDISVDDPIVEAAREAVASGWWSMGPRVQEFEEAFALHIGAKHALAVANGTAAIELALEAAGIGPGDEVVVPSLNFVAAANTIRHRGATPVFCDIVGGGNLNLDAADVEAAIGPRTRAILVLHYAGVPADMDALSEIAARHGLILLEDAAHAPGASFRGKGCGTFGAVGCFSFFSNKNLAVGEGGMVVTDDPDLAERLRLLRSHGMTTLTWDRHRGHAASYDVLLPGYNQRFDEIRAAIGLVQLGRLDAGNEARGRHLAAYRQLLDDDGGIALAFPAVGAESIPSHHIAVAILPPGVDRSAVQESLREGRIQTSVHYPPIHTFSAYEALHTRPLPRTDEIAGRIVTLPLFPALRESDVELVATSLKAAVGAAGT
jgi:dTDP-4-amino-4,6-dideoxygalactose transaminase